MYRICLLENLIDMQNFDLYAGYAGYIDIYDVQNFVIIITV